MAAKGQIDYRQIMQSSDNHNILSKNTTFNEHSVPLYNMDFNIHYAGINRMLFPFLFIWVKHLIPAVSDMIRCAVNTLQPC